MRHRFDVADAAALPWPDSSVDLVVTWLEVTPI
jgi:ubiquinone/menaquinone biosynthesis C-methylase UbiE